MNAVLSSAAGDQLQRIDSIRRRNAESAYDRHAQYNGKNDKTIKQLEALLLGVEEQPTEVVSKKKSSNKLGAGQMKQVTLPLGKTLEESIAIWRDVRKEALSEMDPQPNDFQLAAKASAEILSAEMKIALHNRAKAIREEQIVQQAAMQLPPDHSTIQRKVTKALEAYSFHSHMPKDNYTVEWPTFYQIA